jgi:uncharacterized protein YcnI
VPHPRARHAAAPIIEQEAHLMTLTASSRRRARLTLGGLTLGGALVLAAPLAASAHVHVTPEEASANASTRLAFSFSHGCDGSPTTALTVQIPEGVDGVTPVLDGAWSIERELGDDGIPTRVTYTAMTPVEDGLSASVSMDVIFASSVAESDVAFPVLQTCATGQTDWAEVAEDGQDPHDLDAPAPVVAVGTVAETDGDGHGSEGEHASEAPHDSDADGSHTEAAAASDAGDPVARWLAGGALVAALAALGVTLLRRRSS